MPIGEAENPGGSRMEDADFDLGLGGEWSSRTHDGYDGLGVIVVIFELKWNQFWWLGRRVATIGSSSLLGRSSTISQHGEWA